jgi:hypothetical protein
MHCHLLEASITREVHYSRRYVSNCFSIPRAELFSDGEYLHLPDVRIAICYTRGVALHVFAWIRKQCIVKNPNGEIMDDLPSKYVVELLDALLAYKLKTDKRKLKGAPHCAFWMLKAQVSKCGEM